MGPFPLQDNASDEALSSGNKFVLMRAHTQAQEPYISKVCEDNSERAYGDSLSTSFSYRSLQILDVHSPI